MKVKLTVKDGQHSMIKLAQAGARIAALGLEARTGEVDTTVYGSRWTAAAAQKLAEAERDNYTLRWLRRGLKLTDDEMAKAEQLAELALSSGAPGRFLGAVTALDQKPVFLPCSCWWCRLKRWIRKVTRAICKLN